jgi:hypothetical protein
MMLLRSLGDEAAGPSSVTLASFVNGALRELSMGLCRSCLIIPSICWHVGMMVKRSHLPGWPDQLMSVPRDECME